MGLVKPVTSVLDPMMHEDAEEYRTDYMLVFYRDEKKGGEHVGMRCLGSPRARHFSRVGNNVLTLVGRLDYMLFYKDFTKDCETYAFKDVLVCLVCHIHQG